MSAPARPTVNPRVIPSQLPFDGRVVCPALAAALDVAGTFGAGFGHPVFTRIGPDLRATLPITLQEASFTNNRFKEAFPSTPGCYSFEA